MKFRSLAVVLVLSLCGAAPAVAGVRIALLPIAVHAAGEESGHLQSGLAEMIASRLDQYEGVTVVRPRVEGSAPSSLETARAAAQSSGADFVLYGSFTRFGDGASLDLRCARVAASVGPEAEQRRLFIQSGALAEIIPKLDTLAQKVARYAHGRGTPAPRVAGAEGGGAGPAPVAGPSTSDFEALVQRVNALERALIPAVAEKSEKAGEGGSVVR